MNYERLFSLWNYELVRLCAIACPFLDLRILHRGLPCLIDGVVKKLFYGDRSKENVRAFKSRMIYERGLFF